MANLKKTTLSHNEKKSEWQLREDKSNRLIESFGTKAEATKGGVLEKALGPQGGSVKIQTKDGKYEEERTYPGKKDPPESKG
jgi:hypothetical protein